MASAGKALVSTRGGASEVASATAPVGGASLLHAAAPNDSAETAERIGMKWRSRMKRTTRQSTPGSYARINVPAPRLVKNSSSIAWGTRPSSTTAASHPASTA